MPTIKTLFGQARHCAYPACAEPLIFEDRNVTTVVAEIAHIRSKKTNGPRHDPTFTADIDGPDNLLLLCGKHHAPVDRHESIYPTDELLRWKTAQVQASGSGTAITVDEAKRFVGTSHEVETAVAQLARLTARVENACAAATQDIDLIERARLRELNVGRLRSGPMYGRDENGDYIRDDDGQIVNLAALVEMSPMETTRWDALKRDSRKVTGPAVTAALNALAEEVNVLVMMSPSVGAAAQMVLEKAHGVAALVELQLLDDSVNPGARDMNAALRDLWLTANSDS